MKTISRAPESKPMSADAYAGFLKLWLTPATRQAVIDGDVEAYLAYVGEREPLSDGARRAAGLRTDRAA